MSIRMRIREQGENIADLTTLVGAEAAILTHGR